MTIIVHFWLQINFPSFQNNNNKKRAFDRIYVEYYGKLSEHGPLHKQLFYTLLHYILSLALLLLNNLITFSISHK